MTTELNTRNPLICERAEVIMRTLIVKLGVDYISDLRITDRREEIKEFLETIHLEKEDLEVWEYIWNYIDN